MAIRELTRCVPSMVPTGGTVTPLTTRMPAIVSPPSARSAKLFPPQASSRMTTMSDKPAVVWTKVM